MANKVLMVDDDKDFIEAVATLLSASGYDVVTAQNGEEGFEKAKTENPDLISLDVMMQNDSEGFNIAKQLSSDDTTKDIPVIIVTGIKKAFECAYDYETGEMVVPAKAFLEKPIDPELFLKTVQNYIRK